MSSTVDEEMRITHVPMSDIYLDESFNTRTSFMANDVGIIELARSIAKDGLQQPIVIQPRLESTPPQFKYVIVAGHRRFTAFKVNQATTIPCVIRANLEDFQALRINIVENLKRQDYNLLEEANIVAKYRAQSYTRQDIADELNMSPGWVQIREMVLDLPEPIQKECANGTYSATQIRDLNSLKKNPEEQIEAARRLKEARERGEAKTVDKVMKKKPKAGSKKQRTPQEMKDLMNHWKDTFQKFDVTTRVLAWAAGEIDNSQLYLAIHEEAVARGIPYTMPEMVI